MRHHLTLPSRRRFLGSMAFGAVVLGSPRLFAEELTRTPDQTAGPFYPNRLPLDTDNDLLIVNSDITPAVGSITHLTGTVRDAKGRPMRNMLVEIWQCDSRGIYLHTEHDARNRHRQDKHFQGFGRFLTGTKGEYYFRTIKPVPYSSRTPHIHFKVKKGSDVLLATQCYVKGHPLNRKDGIYLSVENPTLRSALEADFVPIKGSRLGELAATFDIVLGLTPSER
jgi:protocatechuate 3,4-dioxygenase, beta subunit